MAVSTIGSAGLDQAANTTFCTTSGNVGIGTSSPVTLKSAKTLQVLGNIKAGNVDAAGLISLGDTASTGANAGIWRGAAGAYGSTGNYLNLGGYDGITFTTGNAEIASQTERMRIDSSGRVGIGGSGYGPGSNCLDLYAIQGVNNAMNIKPTTNSSYTAIQFFNSSQSGVGAITCTTSATTYGSGSDYRLKENVLPMTGALNKVAQLRPVTFDWISDKTASQGFIAHELQAVVPDCVVGEKDGVDADGNPKYQNVDTRFLVATLTAAIQEQQALITTLTTQVVELQAKVAALENK